MSGPMARSMYGVSWDQDHYKVDEKAREAEPP